MKAGLQNLGGPECEIDLYVERPVPLPSLDDEPTPSPSSGGVSGTPDAITDSSSGLQAPDTGGGTTGGSTEGAAPNVGGGGGAVGDGGPGDVGSGGATGGGGSGGAGTRGEDWPPKIRRRGGADVGSGGLSGVGEG
jgi:hypothetical protein